MSESIDSRIPREKVQWLLEQLSDLGNFTTILFSGGSVFEIKGPFPKGYIGNGFYNLEGSVSGLQGHLNLTKINHIDFQEKPHRGVESFAFVFKGQNNDIIFKVFLGRDEEHQVLEHQKTFFSRLKTEFLVDTKPIDEEQLS